MLNAFKNQPLTIIKLGGSLFDLPHLADRLLQFLDQHQFEHPIIIPGGGKFADEVRKLDQQHSLCDQLSHELGIRTLTISSRFVAGLSEEFELVMPDELSVAHAKLNRYPIVDIADFVLRYSPLRSSWDVTSDSIAAWIASLHPESQLVLLKSFQFPASLSLSQGAELNYVDAGFPEAAQMLKRISWCDFRSEDRKLIYWELETENSQRL